MALPKWRFMREDGTEFPEWEELTLGNRFTFKNGINASREAFRTAGIHCIGVSDVIKCLPILATNVIGAVSISDKEAENNKVNYGDILFQRSSETQQDIGHASVYIDNTSSVYNGFVICGKPDKLFYNPIFLHNALQIYKVRKQTISLGAGAQHYNIGQEELAQIKVNIPCLEEQKRIADFFSVVDEVIAQSKSEVQNLEQQKKAVMQKIFSQEVRFRREDGTGFPEWDTKRISEFANCFAGATPSTTIKEYWDNGTILWLSSGEVNKKQIYSTEKRISQLGYDKSSTKMIKPNTVVMALAGQGKTRGTVAITRIDVCTNQSLCAIETDDTIVDDYLFQYLETQYDNLRHISSGDGTRGGLNLKLINDFSVIFPCLEEQQKIADFLSAYDEAITFAKHELDKWKELKKGLLQQMFV